MNIINDIIKNGGSEVLAYNAYLLINGYRNLYINNDILNKNVLDILNENRIYVYKNFYTTDKNNIVKILENKQSIIYFTIIGNLLGYDEECVKNFGQSNFKFRHKFNIYINGVDVYSFVCDKTIKPIEVIKRHNKKLDTIRHILKRDGLNYDVLIKHEEKIKKSINRLSNIKNK